MSCKFVYYVEKAYDIPIVIHEDSSVSLQDLIADIGSDIIITLTHATDSSVDPVEFSQSNNKISISGNTITLLILHTDVTTPGFYNIKIEYFDSSGKFRGIVPCPKRMRFFIQ